MGIDVWMFAKFLDIGINVEIGGKKLYVWIFLVVVFFFFYGSANL